MEKVCSSCKASKDSAAFSKHARSPGGLRRTCRECASTENRANYERNAEKRRADARVRVAEWRKVPVNAEKNRRVAAEWYVENAAVAKARALQWVACNEQRKREADRAWRLANPARAAASTKAYKLCKIQAMPGWADRERILDFYLEAARLNQSDGQDWQVDHIVPLRSKLVCGLHVESNLQVLEAAANRRKSNQLWPDMP